MACVVAAAIVAAVSRKHFTALGVKDFQQRLIEGGCFIDVKASLTAIRLRRQGLGCGGYKC
jgi:UDP-N-acetyl-D-galactosamine dehydrogenase